MTVRASKLLPALLALAAAACVQPDARTRELGAGWRLRIATPVEEDGRLVLPGVVLAAADGSAATRWQLTPFLDLNGDGRRQVEEPHWPGFSGRASRPVARLRTGRLAVPDPRAILALEVVWTDDEGRHRAWVPWGRR